MTNLTNSAAMRKVFETWRFKKFGGIDEDLCGWSAWEGWQAAQDHTREVMEKALRALAEACDELAEHGVTDCELNEAIQALKEILG